MKGSCLGSTPDQSTQPKDDSSFVLLNHLHTMLSFLIMPKERSEGVEGGGVDTLQIIHKRQKVPRVTRENRRIVIVQT